MNSSPYELALRELSASAAELRPSDIMFFSEPLRAALNFVIRLGVFSLNDFAQKLGAPRAQAQIIAEILVKRNLFIPQPERSTPEEPFYKARLSASARPANRPPNDIWKKLE
ncbi:MAG: hypothetical protein Fur002_13320 [Anaerolineales bacterium]